MSYTYDSSPRYHFNRRTVHWDDQSITPSKEETNVNPSDLTTIKKRGQHISLNASLPFHSKLNIRIHANRAYAHNSNESDQIRATATIQRLTPEQNHQHNETLRQSYIHHYSTFSPNDSITTRTNSPIQHEKFPQHRQMSLPISLPIDRRLILYIRGGEVIARC
jgi:hypothetical protein